MQFITSASKMTAKHCILAILAALSMPQSQFASAWNPLTNYQVMVKELPDIPTPPNANAFRSGQLYSIEFDNARVGTLYKGARQLMPNRIIRFKGPLSSSSSSDVTKSNGEITSDFATNSSGKIRAVIYRSFDDEGRPPAPAGPPLLLKSWGPTSPKPFYRPISKHNFAREDFWDHS